MTLSTKCVCLILPILCLLPLNKPSSYSRLKSKHSATWCLPSGTWEAHHQRADMLRAGGGHMSGVFIHSYETSVHSLSWAFCTQSPCTGPSYGKHHSQKPLESGHSSSQELSALPISHVSTSQKTTYPFGLLYTYDLAEDNAFPVNLSCPHFINKIYLSWRMVPKDSNI